MIDFDQLFGLKWAGQTRLSNEKNRLHFIDGFRGVASVIVLCFHAFPCFFFADHEALMRPFGRLLDGTFAVEIFFVLSGFSLSIGYFQKMASANRPDDAERAANDSVKKMCAARYFRLAIPALAASLLVYLISRSGLNFYTDLPKAMRFDWWTWAYGNTAVSLPSLLKFSLYDIFFAHAFIPVDTYNGVYYITNLWTMSVEMFGSMLVFLLLIVIGSRPKRRMVLICSGLLFWIAGSEYALFIAGMIIADFYAAGFLKFGRHVERVLFVAFLLAFFIPRQSTLLEPVLCTAMVAMVAGSSLIQRMFNGLKSLGRISFSLYLVHIPVIISLESWLYLHFSAKAEHSLVIVCLGSVTVALSLVLAHCFKRVDKFAISASHRIANFVLGTSSMKVQREALMPADKGADSLSY